MFTPPYIKTLRQQEKNLQLTLEKLKSNDDFQEFKRLIHNGREDFIRLATQIDTDQKAQDKCLGAVAMADLILMQSEPQEQRTVA